MFWFVKNDSTKQLKFNNYSIFVFKKFSCWWHKQLTTQNFIFFLLNIAVKYGYVDIVREMIQYYDNITLSIIIWLNNSIVTVFSVLFSIFSELHSDNRINLFCSKKKWTIFIFFLSTFSPRFLSFSIIFQFYSFICFCFYVFQLFFKI